VKINVFNKSKILQLTYVLIINYGNFKKINWKQILEKFIQY